MCMASRKIRAAPTSKPVPKNPKPPFSAAKLMVANAILVTAVAGVIALTGCPPDSKNPIKPEKDGAIGANISSEYFTITKENRVSVHNSLATFPSGTSESVALVAEAGNKLLEPNKLGRTPDNYVPLIDYFIELYDQAGGEMVDAALAHAEELPDSKRGIFLEEANLTIVALLLRPYAAWEGPAFLKSLDQLISGPEFSQESLDRFAFESNLMREYAELTMNIGNQLYF